LVPIHPLMRTSSRPDLRELNRKVEAVQVSRLASLSSNLSQAQQHQQRQAAAVFSLSTQQQALSRLQLEPDAEDTALRVFMVPGQQITVSEPSIVEIVPLSEVQVLPGTSIPQPGAAVPTPTSTSAATVAPSPAHNSGPVPLAMVNWK
jgi:hypothetical protein